MIQKSKFGPVIGWFQSPQNPPSPVFPYEHDFFFGENDLNQAEPDHISGIISDLVGLHRTSPKIEKEFVHFRNDSKPTFII